MLSAIMLAKSSAVANAFSSMSSSAVLMRSITRPFHLRAHIAEKCWESSGTRVLPSSRSDMHSVRNFCVWSEMSFLISKSRWSKCLLSGTSPRISISASMNSSIDSVASIFLSILVFLLNDGGLAHEIFYFLIGACEVVKTVPSLCVNALGCAAFGAANERVIDTAKVFIENFRFAQVLGGAFAIELLEPLDQTIAVEYALDGVIVIDFFLERFGRVVVVLEHVRFPVENGIVLLTVYGADEKQVDEAFAETFENVATFGAFFVICAFVVCAILVMGVRQNLVSGVLVELYFGFVVA